jgi:hypothetical protein
MCVPVYLIPYTSSAMVGDQILASCFTLLDCIIEEKVDQNSIDLRIWMLAKNLFADKLHAPNAAT